MLIHHWSHPTTPAGTGWDIVQTNVVRLATEKGFAARAALGEAEIIRVIVDDLTGTRDYKTLHRWYLVEDETPGEQLVWNGYISDQWIDNGEDGDIVYPTGVGRRWELEITQENTLLGFRVIQGADDAAHGKRPAESPGERLDWILGSDFLSTVLDHGLIDWTALNALPDMDETRYHGQTAADVLRDISLKTGFNHYVRYRDASSDIELAFFDANTSPLDASTFRVSNVEADVDFVTTWPPFFAGYRLHRKGDRVAAGMYVQGSGVNSYGYDLDTSYEFGFRDMVVQDANSKTQAGVDRLRDRLLAQHNEQDERIVGLRVQVPAADLNIVKHGQKMEARFIHLPGWEDFRSCRVVSKAFSRPEGEPQDRYDVDLELSPMVPEPVEQFYTHTEGSLMISAWPDPPGGGNTLIGYMVLRSATTGIANTPTGHDGAVALAGYDWTFVDNLESMMLAMRHPSAVDEPQITEWPNIGGTARPRVHMIEVAGLAGTCDVVAKGKWDWHEHDFDLDVYTIGPIVTTGAGFIYACFERDAPGPDDGFSSAYTMDAPDPWEAETQGYGAPSFAPNSWAGGLWVEAAGSYSVTITSSARPRDAEAPVRWMMAYFPGA